MAGSIRAAGVAEIPPGQARLIETQGHRVAVFNVDGTFYAIADTCPHRGGPLSGGTLEGFQVTCPWHGAKFDVRTGKVLAPPATRGVQRYAIKVEGSDIYVELPPTEAV